MSESVVVLEACSMNVPKEKGNALAGGPPELRSVEGLGKGAPRKNAGSRADASGSSIAPVGLDHMRLDDSAEEDGASVGTHLPPPRSRRLRAVVIGTVAGCALILVAAGIARVGHASSAPSIAAASPETLAAPAALPPVADPPPTPVDVAPPAAISTGTLRLEHGAVRAKVLLDGKKLTSTSAMVSCGTHQIKVGRGRTHSVDVPCGGDIGVSK
jgi:hypothetical protein